MSKKTNVTSNKRSWRPSPLIGQIVLVTTCNADGSSNIAPKSWISMMVFDPPILALGCNRRHWTARNIFDRKDFVVNVPGDELATVIWDARKVPHPRPVEAIGLTSMPAVRVAAPRVAECKAHLECVLQDHLSYGDEVILLGRIVAVSVDDHLPASEDPYEVLRMVVFLEQGKYGVIERSHPFITSEG